MKTGSPPYLYITRIAAWLGCVAALSSIIGWHLSVHELIQVNPGWIPAQYNTGVGLLLIALSVLLLGFDRKPIAVFTGSLVLLFGSVNALHYQFNFTPEIGVRFFDFFLAEYPHTTIVAFVLSGVAILLSAIDAPKVRGYPMASGILGSLIISQGLVGFFGYMTKIGTISSWNDFTEMALSTSVGFLALGSSFILLGIERSQKDNEEFRTWLPVPVGIGLITLAVTLGLAMKAHEKSQITEIISAEGKHLKDVIIEMVSSRTTAIDRMAGRWNLRGYNFSDWQDDALNYISDHNGLDGMGWLNAELELEWYTPQKERGGVVNEIEVLRSSLDISSDLITTPINKSGAKNMFMILVPVFKNQSFDGFIAGHFRVDRLLSSIGKMKSDLGYAVEIIQGGEVIFENSTENRHLVSDWEQKVDIPVNDQVWSAYFWPVPHRLATLTSPLPDVVLVIGSILAVVISYTLYVLQISRKRANEIKHINETLEDRIEARTAQLQASREKYQDLYDHAPNMYVSVDPGNSRIKQCNQTLCQKLNYDREEIIGQEIYFVYHPDCVPEVEKAFMSLKENGIVRNKELQLKRKDGSQVDVLLDVTVVKNEEGVITTIRFSWQDVTDLKLAEKNKEQAFMKLGEAEEVLQLALTAGDIGVWNWGITEGTLEWDKRMHRIFGVPESNVVTQYEDFRECVHPDDIEDVEKVISNAFDQKTDFETEYRILWPDKSIKHIKAAGRILRDKKDNPQRMIGTCYDISEKIHDKQELQQQQQTLNLALEAGNIGVWDWDLQSGFIFWDENMYRLYDMPKRKFKNRFEDYASRVHPDDIKDVEKKIKECLEMDRDFISEFRVFNKKGKVSYLAGRAKLLRDNEDKPARMIGTNMDITPIKQVEQELRRSESFKQKILDMSVSGLYIFDFKKGINSYINPQYTNLTGYSHEDFNAIASDEFFDLFHPEDQAKVTEHMKRVTSSVPGKIHQLEYRFKTKSGDWIWCLSWDTLFAPDDNQEPNQFLGTFIDITELKNTEKELISLNKELEMRIEKRTRQLVESEERIRHMVEEVQDYSIILLDTMGIVQNWNKGAQRIKGYTPVEIVGKSFEKFYTADDRKVKKPRRLIEIASREGRSHDEGWRVRKDGSLFWASVSITAIHDKIGSVTGFSEVTRDLTERKEDEEEIAKLNSELTRQVQRLEEINRELESFSYSVSHDLRAPLRIIDGFCRILEEDYGETIDEEGKGNLDAILTNVGKMSELINDLLHFSRVTRDELRVEKIELRTFIDEIVKEIQGNSPLKARIRVIREKVPFIYGDQRLLRQVFHNVINNAIKYSSTKKSIKIRIGTLPADQSNGMVTLFIKDNGVGFNMKYHDQLFAPFQRLHSEKDFEGSGIGLALVQRIINKHGGRVWAESQPERGATFYFSIPKEKTVVTHVKGKSNGSTIS